MKKRILRISLISLFILFIIGFSYWNFKSVKLFGFSPINQIKITYYKDPQDYFDHKEAIVLEITDQEHIKKLTDPLRYHIFKNDGQNSMCLILDNYKIEFDNGFEIHLSDVEYQENSCLAKYKWKNVYIENDLPKEFFTNLKEIINQKNSANN